MQRAEPEQQKMRLPAGMGLVGSFYRINNKKIVGFALVF